MTSFKSAALLVLYLAGTYAYPQHAYNKRQTGYGDSYAHSALQSSGSSGSSGSRGSSGSSGRPAGFEDSGNSVLCQASTNSDGSLTYECDGAGGSAPDLTLRSKHVLWLNGGGAGQDRTLNVNVPNYKLEGIIQAAHNKEGPGGSTNININLKRPEISYIAQKEDAREAGEEKFNVNFEYEKLNGQTVHFADDGAGSQRYSPLRGSIGQPGSDSASASASSGFN